MAKVNANALTKVYFRWYTFMSGNCIEAKGGFMLMTPNKAQAANITDKGKDLLRAIRAADEAGITRKGLSDAIGKALNKWDIAQLDLLEDQGLITSEARRVGNRTLMEYVYRAK